MSTALRTQPNSFPVRVGEKAYHDCYQTTFFTSNPYRFRVVSPYGINVSTYFGTQAPSPRFYTMSVQQTIQLNAALNAEAQAAINAKEPRFNIWEIDQLDSSMSNMTIATASSGQVDDKKRLVEKGSTEKRQSIA